MKIEVTSTKKDFKKFSKDFQKKIHKGVKEAAQELLHLSSVYVPVDTGKLKASGHLEAQDISYNLVWDAEAANGFQYGYKQYTEIFNHKDGRYRSQWVHRALEGNQEKLKNICISPLKNILQSADQGEIK
jgi:hypothetical protein